MKDDLHIFQVSEINRYVKGLIEGDPGLRDIWISGEISNFKHHRSGHMYFTLKDSNSSLRSVFFRRDNQRLLFQPEDGMEVILHGNLAVYEPDGVYQLYVSEMEPAGRGSLFIAFEQLKKKLEGEGLFRSETKKSLPLFPRKIALITSPTGAALQDMLTTFRNRYPCVEILVVESLVQGAGAAEDLVRALDLLNGREDLDLIILARGGGSLEDLWPFNEEVVARAIYRSQLPVISGVGHETDFTIADFVADLRAPTPTAAAVASVPDYRDLCRELTEFRKRILVALQRRIQREKQLLDYTVGERFFKLPGQRVRTASDILTRSSQELKREMIRSLQVKGMALTALSDRLEGHSPLKIMDRGYSFCRDENDVVIRSVKNISAGQLLKLTFTDGRAHCRAEEVVEEDIILERS